MILSGVSSRVAAEGIPRESGDDPQELWILANLWEYSPRERG